MESHGCSLEGPSYSKTEVNQAARNLCSSHYLRPLSSEKIRISLQKLILLVTRSLAMRLSSQKFTSGLEAFCIGMTLHGVDAT